MFDKYSINGAVPLNLLVNGNFNYFGYQTEDDCIVQPYSYPYYDENGQPIRPTEEEESRDQQVNDSCLQRVATARYQAKVNDIALSAFYLFAGAGMLLARRREW